ncbi:carcinine hydrolase/isopenicillin-N N-acyltransferase family protein [Eubacterium oxidoreducens]|uniref:Acyl-coenzyme A:6-aminopenicillanic acid acyl-transferase n=1 Tax=Eubacterium oxidoreducens TaxID=1732 RepID=A0A1G6ATZ1_EUBOX|nr:C45 family peptidase [Eubacterium oxidoreducens]SDB11874.1 Acyl-coenzyme A:6-aminopenicillanic acid acyl-transferase [Eubacterium oxidoreducens]
MDNKKLIKTIATIGAGAAATAMAVAATIYRHEIRSMLSMRKMQPANPQHRDGVVYSIRISGDYGFDEYLAQGGADSDEKLNAYVEKQLTKGLFKLKINTKSVAGCSSFTARNLKGERLYARNYDLRESAICIVHTNPGNARHKAVSTADLKFLGIEPCGVQSIPERLKCVAAPYAALDGMNDAGVACAIHMSHQNGYTHQRTGKPGLNASTMIRMILDYADDVEHAIELIRQYDYHDSNQVPFHLIIADKSGKSAVLEWVNGKNATDIDGHGRKLVVTYNEKPYQCLTNFIIVPDYYEQGARKEGLDRYEIIERKLKECKGTLVDEKEAMELLKATAKRHLYGDDVKITLYSIVYNLTNLTATWVGNEHFEEEAYRVKLSL